MIGSVLGNIRMFNIHVGRNNKSSQPSLKNPNNTQMIEVSLTHYIRVCVVTSGVANVRAGHQ